MAQYAMLRLHAQLGMEREDVISPWNSLGRTLQEDLLSLWDRGARGGG